MITIMSLNLYNITHNNYQKRSEVKISKYRFIGEWQKILSLSQLNKRIYLKLGQYLSNLERVVPQKFTQVLHIMQDSVPPPDQAHVKSLIQSQLKVDIKKFLIYLKKMQLQHHQLKFIMLQPFKMDLELPLKYNIHFQKLDLNVIQQVVAKTPTKIFALMIFKQGLIHCDAHACYNGQKIKVSQTGFQLALLDHRLYLIVDKKIIEIFSGLQLNLVQLNKQKTLEYPKNLNIEKDIQYLPIIFLCRTIEPSIVGGNLVMQ